MNPFAFFVAIAVLVTVHEYGHYRMAVACGVKVLRFSIGLGPALWKWRRKGSDTEFVIAAIPLGGYVRMLDRREEAVPADQEQLAFDTQPLRSRVAIVSAGPLANLLLACVLFSVVAWVGIEEPMANIAHPPVGSLAAEAGLRSGDLVTKTGPDQASLHDIQSFDELRWALTQAVVSSQDLVLQVAADGGSSTRTLTLKVSSLGKSEVDANVFRQIGITAPFSKAVLSRVAPSGAADRFGLKAGDEVKKIGDLWIDDGAHLREVIRTLTHGGQPLTQTWLIQRASSTFQVMVTPDVRSEGEARVGRMDIEIGTRPTMVTVHRGVIDGVVHGVSRTWDMGVVSLRMLGKMLVGQASIKNLSGPLTIADYAGQSAHRGLTYFLDFLAVVSVSLGILNLLPVPVLDGGHLMYYLWEGVTGKPLPDAWTDRLQRGGVAALILMMSVAFFNDVTRYWVNFLAWFA